eukprot:5356982-Amphidinium_carterae.1
MRLGFGRRSCLGSFEKFPTWSGSACLRTRPTSCRGFTCKGNLLALIISQAAVKRRALTLIEYNRKAPVKCHIVASASAPRVSCVACCAVGPMVYKAQWLRTFCSRSVPFDLNVVEASLQSEYDAACLRHGQLSRLIRLIG